LAILKLAVLVSGVLALAKLGFSDFITGGFDTGRFEGLPLKTIDFKPASRRTQFGGVNRRSKTNGFGICFYFLFTIVMKVLISCTENPKIFIEVLDELELFIDKKVIFDEKKISVGAPSAVCQQIL
jgi:hypothetical protein